jgi:hypothetical protein
MRAVVEMELAGGARAELGPGDVIGRVASASLVLDDPRISEAHAMVSLRHGELYLLSLRRLVAVAGKPVSEVLLAPGVEIDLAGACTLRVARVTKPAHVHALRAKPLGTRPLGQVASVVEGPPVRLVGRFVPGAAAHVWSSGPDEWRYRLGERAPKPLVVGEGFAVGDVRFELCAIALAATSHEPTAGGGIMAPLHIVAHYEGVEIHRPNRPVVTLGGVGARLISELVVLAGPVSWEVVARELWKDEIETSELRHRWDVALGRVRARLREASVRTDLIRSDGGGMLQLVLYDGDRVDDRT